MLLRLVGGGLCVRVLGCALTAFCGVRAKVFGVCA